MSKIIAVEYNRNLAPVKTPDRRYRCGTRIAGKAAQYAAYVAHTSEVQKRLEKLGEVVFVMVSGTEARARDGRVWNLKSDTLAAQCLGVRRGCGAWVAVVE